MIAAQANTGFAQGCPGFAQGLVGNGAALVGRLLPFHRLAAQVDLRQALHQISFGLAHFAGIDDGQHITFMDRVADFLFDPPDGSAGPRRQAGVAGRIVVHHAVDRDVVDHPPRLYGLDLDAGLGNCLRRRELDPLRGQGGQ